MPGDPLLDALKRLGREWPLSSVGMTGLEVSAELEFQAVPFLLALYVDRILSLDDPSRLVGTVVDVVPGYAPNQFAVLTTQGRMLIYSLPSG